MCYRYIKTWTNRFKPMYLPSDTNWNMAMSLTTTQYAHKLGTLECLSATALTTGCMTPTTGWIIATHKEKLLRPWMKRTNLAYLWMEQWIKHCDKMINASLVYRPTPTPHNSNMRTVSVTQPFKTLDIYLLLTRFTQGNCVALVTYQLCARSQPDADGQTAGTADETWH